MSRGSWRYDGYTKLVDDKYVDFKSSIPHFKEKLDSLGLWCDHGGSYPNDYHVHKKGAKNCKNGGECIIVPSDQEMKNIEDHPLIQHLIVKIKRKEKLNKINDLA